MLQNLHDTLDTRQSKTRAVKVQISRADPSSAISWNLVAIGFCLSAFGGMHVLILIFFLVVWLASWVALWPQPCWAAD